MFRNIFFVLFFSLCCIGFFTTIVKISRDHYKTHQTQSEAAHTSDSDSDTHGAQHMPIFFRPPSAEQSPQIIKVMHPYDAADSVRTDSTLLLPQTLPHVSVPYNLVLTGLKAAPFSLSGSLPVSYRSGLHTTDVARFDYSIQLSLCKNGSIDARYTLSYYAFASDGLADGMVVVSKLYPQSVSGIVNIEPGADTIIKSPTDVALISLLVEAPEQDNGRETHAEVDNADSYVPPRIVEPTPPASLPVAPAAPVPPEKPNPPAPTTP